MRQHISWVFLLLSLFGLTILQQQQQQCFVVAFLPPTVTTKSSSSIVKLDALWDKWREETANKVTETLSKSKRERFRQRIQAWEDYDFLTAEVRPKVLVHERDYFRQDTRLSAWESYVIVSVLCASISFSALQGFEVQDGHKGVFLYETVLQAAVHSTAGVAVLAGVYSSMVFSLSILYGKTALGLERDRVLDTFLDTTADIRIRAYEAFSLTLGSFAVLVLLVLSDKLPLAMHLPAGGVGLAALFTGFRDWQTITDSASYIFDDDDDGNPDGSKLNI